MRVVGWIGVRSPDVCGESMKFSEVSRPEPAPTQGADHVSGAQARVYWMRSAGRPEVRTHRGQELAVDKDGKVLVWIGSGEAPYT